VDTHLGVECLPIVESVGFEACNLLYLVEFRGCTTFMTREKSCRPIHPHFVVIQRFSEIADVRRGEEGPPVGIGVDFTDQGVFLWN